MSTKTVNSAECSSAGNTFNISICERFDATTRPKPKISPHHRASQNKNISVTCSYIESMEFQMLAEMAKLDAAKFTDEAVNQYFNAIDNI